MEAIHFEKQEGMLCAQHALNALLQGPYFTVFDLSDIAKRLDEQEKNVMAEAGTDSQEFLQFIEAGSQNMDDSGYFSVQVLGEALAVWGLELVPFLRQDDPIATAAQQDPTTQTAYICNFRQHWFAIRKLGHQWFNLNSMLTGPELISDTYLHLFLTQLRNDGYSIFIVRGALPSCDADEILRICPAEPQLRPPNSSPSNSPVQVDDSEFSVALEASKRSSEHDDASLRQVLHESRRRHEADDRSLQSALDQSRLEHEDAELEAALRISMQQEGPKTSGTKKDQPSTSSASSSSSSMPPSGSTAIPAPPMPPPSNLPNIVQNGPAAADGGKFDSVSQEEIRHKRMAFLDKLETSKNGENSLDLKK